MFVRTDPEIKAALEAAGMAKDARRLNFMTGFGLWMFWVYFAYLAIFYIIIDIWPDYPVLALTSWIAANMPHSIFGVFAITPEDIARIDTPMSHPVVMHIAVWQLVCCLWLYSCSFRHRHRMSEITAVVMRILRKRRIEEKTKKAPNPNLLFLLIFLALFMALAASSICFFIKPFVLNLLNLNNSWSARNDHLEFLLWLTMPFSTWFFPLIFYTNSVAFAKLNPRKAKTSAN